MRQSAETYRKWWICHAILRLRYRLHKIQFVLILRVTFAYMQNCYPSLILFFKASSLMNAYENRKRKIIISCCRCVLHSTKQKNARRIQAAKYKGREEERESIITYDLWDFYLSAIVQLFCFFNDSIIPLLCIHGGSSSCIH